MENKLSTLNKSVIVLESLISVSGQHILVGLKCPAGKLDVGSLLISMSGKRWKVVDNELWNCFSKEIQKMLKEKEAESIFMFDLQGIGHMNRPDVGEELIITEDVS